MQEIPGIPCDGSEMCDKLQVVTATICCMNIKYTSKLVEKKVFVNSQVHLGDAVTCGWFSTSLTYREVQQEHISQSVHKLGPVELKNAW